MPSNDTYNGWTNRETWLVNLWLDQYISGQVYNGEEVTGHVLECYVDSLMDSVEWQSLGLFKDLITCALDKVDWEEIAESAKELEES